LDEAQPENAPAIAPVIALVTDPVIDPEIIEKLRQLDPGDGNGMLTRVLQAYQLSLSGQLKEIGGLDLDAERLARAAHTLKSSSAAVGATAFSGRCAEIERFAQSERRLPRPEELDTLQREGRLVLAAVAAMLAP
jgi:HPt (histidine-containing phosphotransfer) domain-containing protein